MASLRLVALAALGLAPLLAPAPLAADPACLAAPGRACLTDMARPGLPRLLPPGVVPPAMMALRDALLLALARAGDETALAGYAESWGADSVGAARAEALALAGEAEAVAQLTAGWRAEGRNPWLIERALSALAAGGHGATALMIAQEWAGSQTTPYLLGAVMRGLVRTRDQGASDLLWPALTAAERPGMLAGQWVRLLAASGQTDAAIAAAARIATPEHRAGAQAMLAAQTGDGALAAAALSAMDSVANPAIAARLHAGWLPLGQLVDGRDRLAEIPMIPDPGARLQAAVLAARLNPGKPAHQALPGRLLAALPEGARHLHAMVIAADTMAPSPDQALGLIALALAPGERDALLEQLAMARSPDAAAMLAVARQISVPAVRERALLPVIELLAASDPGGALALAEQELATPQRRMTAWAVVAARMP